MNNKHLKRMTLLGIPILFVFLWGSGVLGEQDDPLITLSYLNERLKVLEEKKDPEPVIGVSTGAGLEVVDLKKGQSLIGAAGTEMILRSGKVSAITSANGGLADLTGGKDISSGEMVLPNHQLLLPRSDGRGVKAVTDAIVMVRGTYKVESWNEG